MPKPTSRNLGLDAVRATAILLVLVGHSTPFYKPILEHHNIDPLGWREITGCMGVELFFCLSGFLIGGILLGLEAAGPSWRRISIFYVRRWIRTLPLYYFVLFAISDFPQLDPHLRVRFLSFVTLTQNLFGSMPAEGWFAISWSLTIEEWSYLLLPLITGFQMQGFIAAVIRFISKTSYVIYLFHWPVYFLTVEHLADRPYLLLPVFIFGTVFISGLVSYFVEQPMLRLRPSQYGRDRDRQTALDAPTKN